MRPGADTRVSRGFGCGNKQLRRFGTGTVAAVGKSNAERLDRQRLPLEVQRERSDHDLIRKPDDRDPARFLRFQPDAWALNRKFDSRVRHASHSAARSAIVVESALIFVQSGNAETNCAP